METTHRLPRFFVLAASLVWIGASLVSWVLGRTLWSDGGLSMPPVGSFDWIVDFVVRWGAGETVYLAVGLGAQAVLMRRAGLNVGSAWLGGVFLGGLAASVLGVTVQFPIAWVAVPAVMERMSPADISMPDPGLLLQLRLVSGLGLLLSLTAFALVFAFVQGRLLRPITGNELARIWTRATLRGWLGSALVTATFTVLRLPTLGLASLIPGLVTGLALKRIVEAAPAPPEAAPAPVDIEA